jgi:hypothetical protein
MVGPGGGALIPVGPLIWVVVFAIRALKNRKGAPAARSSRSSTRESLRQLILLIAWLVAGFASLFWPTLLMDRLSRPSMLGAILVPATLLAFVILSFQGPAWSSWRIARPLGLSWLARFLFWWNPAAGPSDRRGYARLIAAALGRPMPREGKTPDPVGAWSTCAAALSAERLGDVAHADRLVAALAMLPRGADFPRGARVIGIEALCWAAADRGDWDAALNRAELGRGRGVRLLRLLATARTAGRVPPLRLWTAWLMAPSRRRSLALVKAALQAEPPRVTGPSLLRHPLARREGPFGLHLALLAESASGRPIPPQELARLVREWEARLDALDEARLRARGLELGARDAAAAAASIRRSILDQLEALASNARQPLPRLEGQAIAAELAQRSRDRLFQALEPFLERSRGDFKNLGSPLQEWEHWLRFREATEAIQTSLGSEGLRTAWHAGLRTTAWNWPCKILNAHDQRGAWASLVMFSWVTQLAEAVGDQEAAAVNRKNVDVARASSKSA